EFVNFFGLTDCTVAVKLSSDMAGTIMDYAAEIDAGMIAIGTHDRHGLLHLIASHVSKNVVNHAHRPIWTKAIR
ncbi:MAG: universal stress protein, partial [Reichenbachiella sp.]